MKKSFFTGLILLLPAVLTLVIVLFLFDFFTTPFLPIVTQLLKIAQAHLPFSLPENLDAFLARILAFILLCIFVILLGMIAQGFLIRNLLKGAHSLVSRIPLLNTVFKVSRDVFSALFSQGEKKVFKRPVMHPFAGHQNFCIGFLAGAVAEECQKHSKEPLALVFTPTAPHPISGFLFLVPQKDVFELDMTNEDAVKYLVSCGLIIPDEHKK